MDRGKKKAGKIIVLLLVGAAIYTIACGQRVVYTPTVDNPPPVNCDVGDFSVDNQCLEMCDNQLLEQVWFSIKDVSTDRLELFKMYSQCMKHREEAWKSWGLKERAINPPGED